MNLMAIFPIGQTEITVNGLHQWDHGRQLEIQADDLPPAQVEVHFSCPGMKDAVVRSCSVTNDVAVAAIPDQCLEQSAPITAWVYAVGESSGETIKTITLTVIPRVRPQSDPTAPEDFGDKYSQAVAAWNGQILAFEQTVKTTLLDQAYPIGSIYMSVIDKSPEIFLGGTWTRWGRGRVPVGVSEGDDDFLTPEYEGGEKTHTLTENELPEHAHNDLTQAIGREDENGQEVNYFLTEQKTIDGVHTDAFVSVDHHAYTGFTGGNQAHNNLQPYITCYMWKRIE